MAGSQDFSVTVSLKASGLFDGRTGEPTVVWLTGEHDLSNASRLSQVVAETIALDEADVVIDLSGASFISGATIAILLRANAFLKARSRSLILRAPTKSAIRLLGLCGLTHLISPPPRDGIKMTTGSDALRTWVHVPTEARERRTGAPASAPARVDVATASELVAALNQAERPAPKDH